MFSIVHRWIRFQQLQYSSPTFDLGIAAVQQDIGIVLHVEVRGNAFSRPEPVSVIVIKSEGRKLFK